MKYISYSVWGDNKVYTYGIIENVLDAKKFYEGWIVRVHYNDTVPQNIVDWLKTQDNVELVHHPGTKKKASNTLWRFEDLFIKDAVTMIRDADSRITERELTLVDDWLRSDKDFHIVRDHRHHTCPIIAGAFGVRNNCLEYIGIPTGTNNVNEPPLQFVPGLELMQSFLKNLPEHRDEYIVDQIFLAQYVYKYVANKSMVHCSHNAYEPFAKRLHPVESGFLIEVITECPRAAEIMGDTETKFERVGAY
ncbi:hypothetical protein OtV6_032c [Ostreococcus tauri virus RT-2011]|nr:hypothetical protein OtV6_032c [Ostreococcus tauri virus RT-2011]